MPIFQQNLTHFLNLTGKAVFYQYLEFMFIKLKLSFPSFFYMYANVYSFNQI